MGITGLVDLHNHLLPGVDDGARTREESEKYLARWAASGVSAAVFTPHLLVPHYGTAQEIEARLDELSEVYERFIENVGHRSDLPSLALGQEVLSRDGADLARVASSARVGLAGTDVILVELGFSMGWDAFGVLDAAAAEGRRVLFAHPERYMYPAESDPIATIRSWRDAGAMLQVNGASLLGRHTQAARRIARQLLREGIATIVASDHHGDHRPDDPATIYELVAQLTGREKAGLLMVDNPARIHAGGRIDLGLTRGGAPSV